MAALLAGVPVIGVTQQLAVFTGHPTPLARAHAHNDYEHTRPLLDALSLGFCSIEADIHLVEGSLLVAHDREETTPERTLQRLYLNPLKERVNQNGGEVFKEGPPLTLLVDIKSKAVPTYQVLRQALEPYQSILTRFSDQGITYGAVTIILSGNRPKSALRQEETRWTALDGRISDLKRLPSPALMPLISDDWGDHFSWNGSGPFPDEEWAQLERLVRKVHDQGRRIRFWNLPDNEAGWRVAYEADVDLINTDNLEELQRFLISRKHGTDE